MRAIPIFFLTLLSFFLLSCIPFAGRSERVELKEISFHVTPGEPMLLHDPMRPAEEIRVQREGTTYTLTVAVNVPRENVSAYREQQAALAAEEWETLRKIVARDGLLDFVPKPESDIAMDFGTTGFALIGEESNVQEWSTILKNETKVEGLKNELARLARDKIADLPLCEIKYRE